MSWAGPGGAEIETPRQESSVIDGIQEWQRSGLGIHRQGKHRAIVAWLLVRVLGMSMVDAARSEGTSPDTIGRRVARVESLLDELRTADLP